MNRALAAGRRRWLTVGRRNDRADPRGSEEAEVSSVHFEGQRIYPRWRCDRTWLG
jgi:hypothetical protein